ncbi:MAG TPA: hypothetical protein VFN48_04400 [Solirubrobacteraceae bacterium]|nr:hypothetical protein [Solirubrobacteraceae bacterium]
MADRRTSQITALRRAIDCLPVQTRRAMLVGIDNNTIVVGAYTTDDGVCPMLAAHRNGGRTNFVAFARSWDEFCFRGVRLRKRRPRLATPTELSTLRAHIESSLIAADEFVDLGRAMTDHRRLVADRERETAAREAAARAVAADRLAAARAATEPAAEPFGRGQRVRPGDPDRSHELSRRHGWRWLRVMRSFDEYEQALAQLEQAEQAEQDARVQAALQQRDADATPALRD